MITGICSECGETKNVQMAREYPDLEEFLSAWHVSEEALNALMCPRCAASICCGDPEEGSAPDPEA